MRLSDKFDTIRRLYEDKHPLDTSEEMPVERILPEQIASTGHKISQKPPFAYLFETGSGMHSPWIPATEAHNNFGFIGAHSYMNGGGYIRDNVLIGRYCSIGRRVTIAAGMHAMDGLSTSPVLSAKTVRPEGLPRGQHCRSLDRAPFTVIDSDVWIGDGAIIMPGVHLALGCVIGANSVVTRDTVPYGIYVGAPAVLRRRRFSDDICSALLESAWWDVSLAVLRSKPVDQVEEFLAALTESGPAEPAALVTYMALPQAPSHHS